MARGGLGGKAANGMTSKHIYKVMFHQQGNLYELYARSVSHGEMYGFLEIGDIIFGERSALLVDPSEEKLKAEFAHLCAHWLCAAGR